MNDIEINDNLLAILLLPTINFIEKSAFEMRKGVIFFNL